MRSMKITVVPKDGVSKVPIAVAGMTMVCVQNLLTHIGEYLVARELRLQNAVDHRLSDMFDLFLDPSAGISLRTTTAMSTSGIIDESISLLERTLMSMGSGAGGYWIDDNFSIPAYRREIAEDVILLADSLNTKGGFCMRFAADSTFDNVDIGRLTKYLNEMTMTYDDATCGVIRESVSRSGKEGMRLDIGDKVKMTFLTPEVEEQARSMVGKGVIAAGRIRYSNGRIHEVSDVGRIVPMENMKFKRMISADGDILLNSAISASVNYVDGTGWNIRNDDLGMNITKDTWDMAVTTFHDYFVFLWNEYSDKDDSTLSDEERDVKEFVLSLVDIE